VKGWLLDTNVVSELRKPRCNEAVKAWSEAQPPISFFLSRVTIAEIRFGIEKQADPAFKAELLTWLDNTLRPWFGERILDLDEEVLLEWRRMVEWGKALGHTFSQPDLYYCRNRHGARSLPGNTQRQRFPEDRRVYARSLDR
jgi:Predicted nucleic acid-binding protein, contains PIN domain